MARRHHRDGFTLIETLVSTLLLGILVLGATASLSHSGTIVQRQEIERSARLAANYVMEFYIYDDTMGTENLEAQAASNGGTIQFSNPVVEDGYTFTATIDVENKTAGGIYFVHVRVRLTGPEIDPITLTYEARSTL